MKYIRTKDGRVIGFNTYRDDVDLIAYLSQFANYQDEYAPIKQADTIEELCDGWIIECPEWDKPTFKRQLQYMNWQDYVKTANKHKATHYACIFVKLQNGAIRIEPVAKMNDKGELELL